jgi:hypothetical protein
MNATCCSDRAAIVFRVTRTFAVIVAVLVLGAVPAHSLDVTALVIDPLTPTVVYAGA